MEVIVRFILKGKVYNLTREEVEAKMEGIEPELARKYIIMVKGKEYPPKQVLAEMLGLGRVEFTTMDAANILRRLGFRLERV
jgi:hypothetical protein